MPAEMTDSYLIFSVGMRLYAIQTTQVQEIINNAKIHQLPFVPDYIEGVVNCRGRAYTVVNLLQLEGEEKPAMDGLTVLVFKRATDQIALHISSIKLFFEPEEDDIRSEGIRHKGRIIPYFDAGYLEETLRRDLKEDD